MKTGELVRKSFLFLRVMMARPYMVQIYLLESREILCSLSTSWETIIQKILGKDKVVIEFLKNGSVLRCYFISSTHQKFSFCLAAQHMNSLSFDFQSLCEFSLLVFENYKYLFCKYVWIKEKSIFFKHIKGNQNIHITLPKVKEGT